MQQDTVYLHQNYEQIIFHTKLHFYISGWTKLFWRNLLDSWVVETWNISTQIWQKCFFYQHPQPVYDVMQKDIDNLEFVQGVHFEFINSLKNNGTKYLLIFDDSCAEICNSEEIVDIVTAGRHRRFRSIYIKHNLFHQSRLWRDVELQSTHIVLFKSLRNVHHVATLSWQLGLRSALVDWYRDVTSVRSGHLLIDLSPRSDDRLRYCTNSGKIPSKFYVPDNLKNLEYLDDERTKSLYSPSIPIHFPRMQISICKYLSKRIYPTSQQVLRQPAARKLVRSRKKSRPKVQRQNSRTVFIKINLEATKKSSFVSKRIIAKKKTISSFVINQLSWDGTVCSSTSFCLQQHQQPNHCHKTRSTQIKTWANSHVAQRYVKKGN